MSNFEFKPIGYLQSPFKDKFGIPRQSGMAPKARGVIKLVDDPDIKTALRTLEEFSHIWVIFVFHNHGGKNWKPSIRPPRFGGSKKVGVLSSRSPHRPNPIGISALKLESLNIEALGGPELVVSGIDLLDETPILDIKPYLPYSDSIPEAHGGWAHDPIPTYEVEFSEKALESMQQIVENGLPHFRDFILDIIELDPRPAFQKRQLPVNDPKTWGTQYGFDLEGFEIKYMIDQGRFIVTEILKL
ncbi:MAG: tRNA (N6-threonylcarbamoyladenosine(37)-N6)-methyltransferase TrmO [Bdellovibrionia bacterium]